MAFFTRLHGNGRLYGAPAAASQLLLVLPRPDDRDEIELEEAWSSTALLGNFVFSAGALGLLDAAAAEAFVTAILNDVVAAGPARAVVWMRDPLAWRNPPLTGAQAPLMGMSAAGTYLETGLDALIFTECALTIANGSELAFDARAATVTITGAVQFSGGSAPRADSPAASATLHLDGADRGLIAFSTYLSRQSLHDRASWGFQYLMPAPEARQPPVFEWLPLADASPNDSLGFRIALDPSDPANEVQPSSGQRLLRSFLAFTGRNVDGTATTLASTFRTLYGAPIIFTPVTAEDEARPARLVFNRGANRSPSGQLYQLAPMGEFTLSAPGAKPGTTNLLCGLHGSEAICFHGAAGSDPGDRIRFAPYRPAFAPRYPFPEVSPVKAPVDVQAPLLEETFTTSWANVVAGPASPGAAAAVIPYVAQPVGSSLYGRDPLIWAEGSELMGWMTPADALPEATTFPLAPYAGATFGASPQVFTLEQARDFERLVVAPTRRRQIGQATAAPGARRRLPSARPGSDASASAGGPFTTTTPSGLIATIDGGTWTQILLGQDAGAAQAIRFTQPDAQLQQAFQTGSLFLVVTDPRHLGIPSDGVPPDATPRFYDTMEIGGWKLDAAVGAHNLYGDYRNVLIVKGQRGRLYDGTSAQSRKESLVCNPEKWTQKEDFATPSGPSELVALSQWLQSYFEDAAKQADQAYFGHFNRIAQDENWTGILFLRMNIARVPRDLAGITSGIADPDHFDAHHFGIEIGQVTNDPSPQGDNEAAPGPRIDGASSMFGLIYYQDPAATSGADGEPKPIPDASGADYGFRLLSLKVLFENTAVKAFQSYAQLTLNAFFGTRVVKMGEGGNDHNALVLHGTLQTNGGQPIYGLSCTRAASFLFDHDVLTKVEILGARMSTRNLPGGPAGAVVSWFDLDGFIDFAVVKATQSGDQTFDFDLFSFGSEPGTITPRCGLSFSGLGLRMASTQSAGPSSDAPPPIALVADELRFDLATSTPRKKSLFRQLSLELQGLVSGDTDRQPAGLGYLNVVTDARLTGVAGEAGWYGIQYRLNMGTPGNLAGKLGLQSSLLTAWSPAGRSAQGSYAAMIGLQLPGTGGGAPLISLETVLKLSIGTIRLTYDVEKRAFLLLLTEIALKFLGLLKLPPAGSTLFYLFGNPNTEGEPSGLGWYAMFRNS